MRTDITITGMCVLSSAGETASILCEQSVLGKTITPQIDLQVYEKLIDSLDTGSHELYRIQKLLLVAFLKASHMAKLSTGLAQSERIGIFLGNSYGLEGFKSNFFRLYKKSDPSLTSPTLFPFTNANALASWLAIQIEAKGPNLTFVNGCTSSSEAILAACDALAANECEVAFVGGVNLIDHDFSDEFYASGFRYESVGMLVLEKRSSAGNSKRKPLAFFKDWQSGILTQRQIPMIKSEKSISKVDNETFSRFKEFSTEIIHLGNNLGENTFNYDKDNFEIIREQQQVLSLGDAMGNAFDTAGILGVGLSIELLNTSQDVKRHAFSLSRENIVFSNIDSGGSTIAMLISKI